MWLDDALGLNVRQEAAVVGDGVLHGLEAAVGQQHLKGRRGIRTFRSQPGDQSNLRTISNKTEGSMAVHCA